MRIRACLILTLAAQEKSKWLRVYTYDDAVIEMEEVAFTFGSFGRVRFRTVFDKPQALRGKPDAKYKTIVEDTELDCVEKVYRVTEMTFLDKKGDAIHSYKPDDPGPWKTAQGFVSRQIYSPACRMIEAKKLQ